MYSSLILRHTNDVVVFYSQSNDLLIAYDNNDMNDELRDKILIKNFNNGDFGINLGNVDSDKYIAVGTDANEEFTCSTEQESILAGLGGMNKYVIPSGSKACEQISSDSSTNIFVNEKEEGISRALSESNNIISTIYGMKDTDLIDFTSYQFSSYEDVLYSNVNQSTIITLPDGVGIKLDNTEIFVATLDGYNLVLYNSTSHNYTTDLESAGINTTSIYDAIDYFSSTTAPSISPTYEPQVSSSSQANEEDWQLGLITGFTVGTTVLLAAGYCIYAKVKHLWPFISVIKNSDIDINNIEIVQPPFVGQDGIAVQEV
jgi:hypothetical protein